VLASSASGAYAVRWRRTDGLEREKVFAVNVDPDEGRLARSGREGLETTLAGVPFTYENAATIDPGVRNVAGVSLVTPLLAILLGILLLEQVVAWMTSYHPAKRRAATP
jgi:hypothetical protein